LPCFEKECVQAHEDGRIKLAPHNFPVWQSFAHHVFSEVLSEKDRENPLILPMARIMAMEQVTADEEIFISEEAESELRVETGRTCGSRTAPAQ
jgi:hypothetical protein